MGTDSNNITIDTNPYGVNDEPSSTPGTVSIASDVAQPPTYVPPVAGPKTIPATTTPSPRDIPAPPVPINSPTRTVPMFTPSGDLADIPAERVHDAIAGGGVIGSPIIAPDGTHSMVPSSRLHEALKAGAKIDDTGWTPEQEHANHPTVLQRLAGTVIGPGTIGEDVVNKWQAATPKGDPNAPYQSTGAIAPTSVITPLEAHQELSKPLVTPVNAMTPQEQYNQPELKNVFRLAGSLSSPENLAIMVGSGGLGQIPGPAGKLISRALSAGWSIEQIHGALQQSPKFMDAMARGDENGARDALSSFVLGMAASAPGVTHVMGKPMPFMPAPDSIVGRAGDVASTAVGNVAGTVRDTAGNIVKNINWPIDALSRYVAKGNEEFGVPLSRGQAGGNISASVENVLRKVPLVNRPFTKLGTAQSVALNTAADNIVNESLSEEGIKSLSPTERGQRIQDALEAANSQASQGYEAAMDNLAKTGAADFPLNTAPLKATAQELIGSLQPAEGFESLVSPGRTKALGILHDIAENEDSMTAGDAIKLRKQISEEVANPTGDVKPYKAVLMKMRGALNDEISNTLSTFGTEDFLGTPESDAAGKQFLQASSRYAEVKEALRNRVIKSVQRSDPQAVGTLLLGKISPEVTASLKKLNPQALVPVGDSLLQTIFDKVQTKNGGVLTGEGLTKEWNNLDGDMKSTVFGSDLPKIQRFVDLVKKIDLQKAKSGWSGSKIASSAATGTAAGVEIGLGLAAHTVPPISATAAGLGLGGYEIGKILTGRGGEAFLETLEKSADSNATPEDRAAASEKLKEMGAQVKPTPNTPPSSPTAGTK